MYTPAKRTDVMSSRTGLLTMCDTRPVVVIVDDDLSIRESLTPLLELAGWRVYCFDRASTFLDWGAPEGAGCVLLDVSLPDLNGLDVQERIAQERPELPIIFLTGYGDIPMTVKAMKAGAVEFLTKPFADDVLLSVVERAIERSRTLAASRSEHRRLASRYAVLSRREREVMHLIVAGLLNKQVGGELGISEITVKAHRGRLMTKMKARSFADLVRMGEKLGIGS